MATNGRRAVKISLDGYNRRISKVVNRFLQHIQCWRAIEDDVVKHLLGRAQAIIEDVNHGHNPIVITSATNLCHDHIDRQLNCITDNRSAAVADPAAIDAMVSQLGGCNRIGRIRRTGNIITIFLPLVGQQVAGRNDSESGRLTFVYGCIFRLD